MVKGDELEVLHGRMNGLDIEMNESYKFFGCEQAEAIDIDSVFKRSSEEMENCMKIITKKLCNESCKIYNSK